IEMFPDLSTQITPPLPPAFTSLPLTTSSEASLRERPLYSIRAEISCATVHLIKNSPCPVPETAQVALFAYVPAPIIGESPILLYLSLIHISEPTRLGM